MNLWIWFKELRSVSIFSLLVGASDRHIDVIGLGLAECGEFGSEGWEVEGSDLLIQFLG